jgi:hypothetical protein
MRWARVHFLQKSLRRQTGRYSRAPEADRAPARQRINAERVVSHANGALCRFVVRYCGICPYFPTRLLIWRFNMDLTLF